ncbi:MULTISPECIES: ABC transporter ATP-binding protein [Brevibacillus]|uniref:ABC transporter ATP-binding protein n=1 Tax=Brevibacillus TaxID=55080 RepID=UPI0023807E06|nr:MULTISPECIES: ABC transporter ATP-binding protein [Brevibacillus]MDH6351345.1 ABC-type multidrug transport system fused ATPase/permease subunit [Brevibacillus sp. 1238]WDV93899.1 ABC transporter ATP-binding protein [Brevibacillus parabrevis]
MKSRSHRYRLFSEMLREVFFQAKGQWKYILVAALSILAISVLEFIIPQWTKVVIDQVIPEQQIAALFELGAAIVGAALLLGVFRFVSSFVMTIVSQGAISQLRNKLYRHTVNLDLNFFDRNRTGDLMSRLTSDVNQLQELVSADTLSIVADFFTFIAICGYLLYVDWQLALLLMSTFPFLFYTSRFFSGRIKSVYRTVRQSSAELSNHLQDTLSGIRVIKSFASENDEIDRFAGLTEINRASIVKASRLSASFPPIIEWLNYIGMTLVLLFGAWQAMHNHITVGDIVAYLAYLRLLQGPVRSFSRMVSKIQQASAAYERIHEVLVTVPAVRNKERAIILPPIQGEILFDNVDFAYEKGVPVLENFYLQIEPQQVTALVGSSGSGKSTIAHLIARLYDVQKGAIFIDGYPLTDVTLESLRTQIGIVSQDVILLNGTIRDNIAYGKPQATREEIEAAARAANALEFIEAFPQGYDTLVGERGVKLSGGQKQRLSIARALLKNPRLIILDEATAALDTESEQLIQSALSTLLPGRTCLVIAHRLSTIQSADHIVVLEKGRIVEAGTHEGLLTLSGRYKTLYDKQFPQMIKEKETLLA